MKGLEAIASQKDHFNNVCLVTTLPGQGMTIASLAVWEEADMRNNEFGHAMSRRPEMDTDIVH